MDTIEIKYGKGGQNKMANMFLLLGVLGIAMVIFIWFIETRVWLVGRVVSIFVSLLGIGGWLKLKLAPKNPDETAIRISTEGIEAQTTPIAKAAGFIHSEDIADIFLNKNYMEIQVSDPDKYAARMKNFFVRDAFIKAKNGIIPISIAEVDVTEEEMRSYIIKIVPKFKNN